MLRQRSSPSRAGGNGRPRVEDEPLLTGPEWNAFATKHRLSNRELEAFVLVCQDLTRKAIAKKLGMSIGSLHTYMNRLHQKLGVQTRVGLVLKAVRWVLAAREKPGYADLSGGEGIGRRLEA